MHTPRIFTSPGMSGYAYSGLSSQEYKDSLCRAITTDLMPYSEFLKVLREFVAELRSTFGELREVDAVFAAKADVVEVIEKCITDAESAESAMRKSVLCRLIHYFYDALQDCATAACNQDVARFMDPDFCRRGAHLQIAKACGILVNALVMAQCCARTFSMSFASDMGERDADSVYHASMALSAYVNAKFSALSTCLNSSVSTEEKERRKAILRMVRHNIELCNKVAELVDKDVPRCFRNSTGSCLNKILNAVESSATECEAMVRNNESAKRRLDTAGKARTSFRYYFIIYSRCSNPRRIRLGEYTRALVYVIGSLFSIYRGYASTDNAGHVVAGKVEHCLRILLALHRISGCITIYKVRKIYLDMCTVYDEIQECITRGLLLNPQTEVGFCNAMLGYLSAMIGVWEKKYGRYFNNTRQTDGSPSQPSTSGLGSTRAGMGRSQAPHMPPQDQGTMPHAYAQPSTSYAHPSTLWDQPSTSGLGSTSAGLGRSQAPYMPPHDPGIMPHAYAQPSTSYAHPSTSGLGGTSTGMRDMKVSHITLPALGSVARIDTQPSASGLGGASSTLEEAQVSTHRSQTPDDDDDEQPSKRARHR